MGQTLSEPIVAKHTTADQDDTLAYAVSGMQGWRISMEDAHATVLNLDGRTGQEKNSFFAVYDGHGGSGVAIYSGRTVHTRLAATEEYKKGDYEAALKRAFLGTDEDLRADPRYVRETSGCTAVAALFASTPSADGKGVSKKIIVANAGDSRSVLSDKGEGKPMSYDHKPGNAGENARIVSAGGFVEFGRVNGNLALSRALGDFEFKQNNSLTAEAQIVTADPEIITHEITGEEEFLVIACDGIWDCMSSQQVIDFVRREIANGSSLEKICEDTMERCLAPDADLGGVGCDNMTMMVVAILNGRTKEEWYAWVKERVESKHGWDTPQELAPIFPPRAPARVGGNPSRAVRDLYDGEPGLFASLRGGVDGEDNGGSIQLPAGFSSALGNAGIVFRPSADGQRSADGNIVYEAHVVDSDESDEDDSGSGGGASVTEMNDSAGEAEERPALESQPEIVSNDAMLRKTESEGNKSTIVTSENGGAVEVVPSTEGSASKAE